MMGNNQNLFFSPEEKGRAFSDVLKEVQEYISSKYSTLMVEGGNDEVKQQVKRYISKYIADYRMCFPCWSITRKMPGQPSEKNWILCVRICAPAVMRQL